MRLSREGKKTLENVGSGLDRLSESEDFQISYDKEPRVCDMVFAGGGAKGVAHIGALWAFERLGLRFKRLAGTSAGAIIASVVSAGFTCDELFDEISTVNFLDLRDGFWDKHLPKFARIAAVSTSYGMYDGSKLQEWLEKLLDSKGANTFGKIPMSGTGMLAELDHQDSPRLSIMASDVTNSCELLMPRDLVLDRYGNLRPDSFPVAAAVRMSISVPFFFTPYKLEESLVVDGAFASNLPLEVFDIHDARKVRWPTFGIRLVSSPRVRNPTTDLFHFGLAVFDTMRYGQSRMSFIEYPTRICRLIEVPTGDIRTLDFGINAKQKEELFLSGVRSVLQTFRGEDGKGLRTIWNFDTYIKLRDRWSYPPMDEPYV
ncbi:MAG: patatin-like phospholipase family protein [Thermoplasmatota archaeon]